MTNRLNLIPGRILAHLASTTALSASLIIGCSNDGNPVAPGPPTPTSIAMSGGFVGVASSGRMTVVVHYASLAGALPSASVAGPIAASGTAFVSSGDTIDLTGTYDPGSRVVVLSGSGFTFSGSTVTGGTSHVIKGGWSGPPGRGFFGCSDGSGDDAYQSICIDLINKSGASIGTANLLLFQSQLSGIAVTAYNPDPFSVLGAVTPFYGPDGLLSPVETFDFSGSLPGGASFSGVSLVATGHLDTRTNIANGFWDFLSDSPTPLASGSWSEMPCE